MVNTVVHVQLEDRVMDVNTVNVQLEERGMDMNTVNVCTDYIKGK